jgi:hypothetical protein
MDSPTKYGPAAGRRDISALRFGPVGAVALEEAVGIVVGTSLDPLAVELGRGVDSPVSVVATEAVATTPGDALAAGGAVD